MIAVSLTPMREEKIWANELNLEEFHLKLVKSGLAA
jgi:hypothetical protein